MKYVYGRYYGELHFGLVFWRYPFGPTGGGLALGRWYVGLENG